MTAHSLAHYNLPCIIQYEDGDSDSRFHEAREELHGGANPQFKSWSNGIWLNALVILLGMIEKKRLWNLKAYTCEFELK